MSTSQEREAERYEREMTAERERLIREQDADRAAGEPLRALQLKNALAYENQIITAREGGLDVLPGTMKDFDDAEEALDERFRKAGTFGSTEHINASNDFHAKKADTLAAIREGRLTNLQQRANSQSERLQSNIMNQQTSRRDIFAAIGPRPATKKGFVSRNMDEFYKGAFGSIGNKLIGSGSKFLFGTPSRTVPAGSTTIPAKKGWLAGTAYPAIKKLFT